MHMNQLTAKTDINAIINVTKQLCVQNKRLNNTINTMKEEKKNYYYVIWWRFVAVVVVIVQNQLVDVTLMLIVAVETGV